ncbi:MAG: hypothetical protein RJB62_295 [Pseudomonadota bacterium]|jgi:phosphatidylglycerophosphate synthase
MNAVSKDRPVHANLKRDAIVQTAIGFAAVVVLGLLFRIGLNLPLICLPIALIVFCAFMGVLLLGLSDHLPHTSLGAANRVTILRAALIANLAALAAAPESLRDHGWTVTALMGFALALDGVDGWVARKYTLTSRFGARLDQELDALYTLVLALMIFRSGHAGGWILLAGLWHYLFHALQIASPVFRNTLPFSQRRRAVCAITLGGLILCLSPLCPPSVSGPLAALVLLVLSASFLTDIVWLWRLHTAQTSI